MPIELSHWNHDSSHGLYILNVKLSSLPVANSIKESVAVPQAETAESIHSTRSSGSMVAPAVRQVSMSPTLKGLDTRTDSSVGEASVPSEPEITPSVNSDAWTMGPTIQQVRISPSLSAPEAESTNVHFRPRTLPLVPKAPSVKSDSPHLARSVRKLRAARQLRNPDAETDSSAESLHEVPVVQPVQAPAPAAPEKAPGDAESESGSESSLGLGDIIGHAPKDLPPQFSRPSRPQVTRLCLFTNLTNVQPGFFRTCVNGVKAITWTLLSSTPKTRATARKKVQKTAARKVIPAHQKTASKVAVKDKTVHAPKPAVVPEPAEGAVDPKAKGPDQLEETMPRPPLSPIEEEDGRETKLEDTLTTSRNSLKPEVGPIINPQLVPLSKVNEILTPKELGPVVLIPDVVNVETDGILHKSIHDESSVVPVLNGIPDTNHIVGLLEGPEQGALDAGVGIPQKGVPAFAHPPKGGGQPFVPVAGVVTEQFSLDKIAKPAGIAVAALTGVGAVVGTVWLFEKAKAFFQRKREGRSRGTSNRKRRHVRDWNSCY
jgi:hypothetical protein